MTDQEAIDHFRDRVYPRWQNELKQLSGLSVHLEAHVGDATNVAKYVENSGVLLYSGECYCMKESRSQ